MPTKVKVRKHTSYGLTIDIENDKGEVKECEFELTFEPADSSYHEILAEREGEHVVIGYLSRDDDCDNPLENCDGGGHILDRRHARGEDKEKIRAALGCDDYGNSICECGCDDGFHPDNGKCTNCACKRFTSSRDSCAVMLDVYSHSGDAWRVHDSGRFFPDERWDVSNYAGIWVPDKYCREQIEMDALGELFRPADVVFTQTYTGSDRKQDTPAYTYSWQVANDKTKGRTGFPTLEKARNAAMRVFKIKLDKQKLALWRHAEAVKHAEQDVETFNQWLSGDCWGIVVETFGPDSNGTAEDEEACWGFIGEKYARESLAESFKSVVKGVAKKKE